MKRLSVPGRTGLLVGVLLGLAIIGLVMLIV